MHSLEPSRDTAPALTAGPGGGASGLAPALLESRQRWRDFARLGADLMFETDAAGRLAFLDSASGAWGPREWLGREGRELLATGSADPFSLRTAARDMRVWLGGGDQGRQCYSVQVAPLLDADGRFLGLRGAARDITADIVAAQAQAAVQRRADAMETLVRRVRQAILAPQMLAAMLESLPAALGLAGAAVLEESADRRLRVAERHGEDAAAVIGGLPRFEADSGWHFLDAPEGRPVGLLAAPRRIAPYAALLVWRDAAGRAFDPDDRHLLGALSDLLFVLLGNSLLQRELERQARTEPLTGLLNRGAFLSDLERRLQRHTRSPPGPPAGALLFLDLDNLKPINDRLGHGAGDAALLAVARLLRDMARPSDVAGRLGGDEFGLWLDGADATVAEARAAAICAAAGRLPPFDPGWRGRLTVSIGCATVAADGRESPEALLARADAAMYDAKRNGRDGWSSEVRTTGEAA